MGLLQAVSEQIKPFWGTPRPRADGAQGSTRSKEKNLLIELIYFGIVLLGTGGLIKYLTVQMDVTGQRAARRKAAARRRELARRLGREVDTQGYEDIVAAEMVISPEAIDVSMADIGGLASVSDRLRHTVLLPLARPELFKGSFLRPARGVLLYGPPGTGKTMMAKALAKESGACFMNVRASTVQSKWFGDTQKLVAAIFSLAEKIAPCIIFVDEVDALLGRRKDNEHEAMTALKTEFMQLWDGLLTNMSAPVTVLAATNRPYELDEAVLRRFNIQIEVPLPDADQREAILKMMVARHWREGEAVDETLILNVEDGSGVRPLQKISQTAEGYSGSDLAGLFCEAAQRPVHEYVVACERDPAHPPQFIRDLQLVDFEASVGTFAPSTIQADSYREQTEGASSSSSSPPAGTYVDISKLQDVMRLMQFISSASSAASASANGSTRNNNNNTPSGGGGGGGAPGGGGAGSDGA